MKLMKIALIAGITSLLGFAGTAHAQTVTPQRASQIQNCSRQHSEQMQNIVSRTGGFEIGPGPNGPVSSQIQAAQAQHEICISQPAPAPSAQPLD